MSGRLDNDGDDAVKALQRMIAYVRAEAQRLGIMDVAVLLGHAADAAVEFTPAGLVDGRRAEAGGDRGLSDH